MWRLTDDNDTSAKHMEAKIQTCLDQGITTFYQADIYGGYTAETVMSAAVKGKPIFSKADQNRNKIRHFVGCRTP